MYTKKPLTNIKFTIRNQDYHAVTFLGQEGTPFLKSRFLY